MQLSKRITCEQHDVEGNELLECLKKKSSYYQRIGKHDNRFPGSIGFVNEDSELFVVKENLLARLFCPHFYLYDHRSREVQTFKFLEIGKCSAEVLDFLNTVRYYSTDSSLWPLYRTYYDDLISEWEIVNKCRFRRRFMSK